VLADAELTADELDRAVVERTGPWAGELVMPAFTGMWPRWRQAIGEAARRARAAVLRPRPRPAGDVHEPAPLAARLRARRGGAALGEVLRRYLHAYGPATPHQFARWLGTSASRAARFFDARAGELEPVEVDGAAAWVLGGDLEAPADPPRGVRLLPYFDAYGVGCHPRERVFPGVAAERALTSGQAGPTPILLVDGVAAGAWRQRRSGGRLALTVEPIGQLTSGQRRELEAQTRRVGEVQEARAELRIGPLPAGRHL
jgi:hypothetical protein